VGGELDELEAEKESWLGLTGQPAIVAVPCDSKIVPQETGLDRGWNGGWGELMIEIFQCVFATKSSGMMDQRMAGSEPKGGTIVSGWELQLKLVQPPRSTSRGGLCEEMPRQESISCHTSGLRDRKRCSKTE
jgi:hypothetical protein